MEITSLPDEILLLIFQYVGGEDVVRNISKVNRLFYLLSQNSSLWKYLCDQWKRWPSQTDIETVLWKHKFFKRKSIEKQVHSLLQQISETPNLTPRNDIEDKLLNFGSDAWEYLENTVNRKPETEDLALKFHAQRLIQDFIDIYYKSLWENHISQKDVNLEEGAVILAQSMGRDFVTPEAINEYYSEITTVTLNKLHPTHTKMQLFEAYNSTFFGDYEFGGLDSETFLPSASFIDQVLYQKRGIQIALCLVYSSIGRRLGLRLSMIGMPKHFVVRVDEPGPYEGWFVDVFTNGTLLTKSQLEKKYPLAKHLSEYTPADVYLRLYRNLIEEYNGSGQIGLMLRALNHSITISPQQEEVAYRIMIQSNYKGRMKEAFADLETLIKLGLRKPAAEQLEKNLIATKQHFEHEYLMHIPKVSRPSNIDIGEIVVHTSMNTRGVVTGWEDDNSGTIKILWDETASEEFVAVTEIRPAKTGEAVVPLDSPHVGNFFSAFRDNRYVPLGYLRSEFPLQSTSGTPTMSTEPSVVEMHVDLQPPQQLQQPQQQAQPVEEVVVVPQKEELILDEDMENVFSY